MSLISHRSFFSVLLMVIIGCSLILMTLQMMCPDPVIDASRHAWRTCIAFTLFKEMQTLVAGLLALTAAIIAVRPVYLQLEKMTVQTDIASRDIISRRLRRIIEVTAADYEHVDEVHSEMMRGMHPETAEFELPFNVHWAHELSSRLSSSISGLNASQVELLGTSPIEESRVFLIQETTKLQDCLDDIYAPAVVDHYEDVSAEQMVELVTKAGKAERDLLDRWLAVRGALKQFQSTYKNEQDLIRKRIRAIDDSIVKVQA